MKSEHPENTVDLQKQQKQYPHIISALFFFFLSFLIEVFIAGVHTFGLAIIHFFSKEKERKKARNLEHILF